MSDRIESMRTYFAAAGHAPDARTFPLAVLRANKRAIQRLMAEVGFVARPSAVKLGIELDASRLSERPAFAYVNAGNWLWKCECGGAEYVDLDQPVGMCCSCWNAADEHRWRPVIIPAEREEIERLLLRRPVANRNWRGPERVADLALENREHGLEAGP